MTPELTVIEEIVRGKLACIATMIFLVRSVCTRLALALGNLANQCLRTRYPPFFSALLDPGFQAQLVGTENGSVFPCVLFHCLEFNLVRNEDMTAEAQ